MSSGRSSADVKSSSADSATNWEVIDILAERTTSAGIRELLVVWKPEWIAKSQIDRSGPVMKRWAASTLEKHIVKLYRGRFDAESSDGEDCDAAVAAGSASADAIKRLR